MQYGKYVLYPVLLRDKFNGKDAKMDATGASLLKQFWLRDMSKPVPNL
jgi:hypothetical protein